MIIRIKNFDRTYLLFNILFIQLLLFFVNIYLFLHENDFIWLQILIIIHIHFILNFLNQFCTWYLGRQSRLTLLLSNKILFFIELFFFLLKGIIFIIAKITYTFTLFLNIKSYLICFEFLYSHIYLYFCSNIFIFCSFIIIKLHEFQYKTFHISLVSN